MQNVTSLPARIIANATRRLETMFPGYFADAKHDHYRDFGWPTTLEFRQLYDMWSRNGLAEAAVEKTVGKCWRDKPSFRETEEAQDETSTEREIRQRLTDIRFWQQFAEADRRSLVGRYAGLILRLADGQPFDAPVARVGGGLDGLVEVIPAWEEQIEVAEWDTDATSETYGKPKMFTFREAAVRSEDAGKNAAGKIRTFQVHPDRVLIVSRDGTVFGKSLLQSGFNDLLTMEKVSGAGGEGFWKNAKQGLRLSIDPAARLDEMAQAMGFADVPAMLEAMNEQVDSFNKGFDTALLTQGMEASPMSVTLPSPEHFFAIALMGFASSVQIPAKILVGSQTGERASQEDADEWAQTCQSRRENVLIPLIRELINRLERFGIIPEKDWAVDWPDLTESSMPEKIERASKMAEVNAKMLASRELVFLPEEIRDVVGLDKLGREARLDDISDAIEDELPPEEGEDDETSTD